MDGWTRRRRGASAEHPWPTAEDHDWALVRLGAPGACAGWWSTRPTSWARTPRRCRSSASVPGSPAPEELLGDDVKWDDAGTAHGGVGGHAANGFAVSVEQRFTHLRVNQHPDGGIAPLRVHGEVVADPQWLSALGTFERPRPAERRPGRGRLQPLLLARHQHHPAGRSRKMDDGWVCRRRDQGNDWWTQRRVGLPAQSEIRALEIDTAYLKGNSAPAGVGVGEGRRRRRLGGGPPLLAPA